MKKIPEKRDEAAKWESKEIGLSDFAEDHKLRQPGTFEKGEKPATDNADKNFDFLS